MTRPLVTTRPLGGSRLGRAAVAGEVPANWYPRAPRSVDEWRTRVNAIRAEPALAETISALAPALDASGAAAQRLKRSAGGRGVVVTTGQQPGLFGGPIYTWSKALTALAFADALERACGVPVAPVFWAATDDADYEETRSTLVAVPGGVEELDLPDPPRVGGPMADMPLGDMTSLLERLAAGAGSAANSDALRAAREAYARPGATVGSAYVRLLRSILEPLGIAVLDASHGAVRQAMHPVIVRALERADDVEGSLEQRSTAIRAAGFEPQVDLVRGLTLVSRTDSHGKARVARERAAEVARAGPRLLGPNVLLRPIAERAILPTVAYLAGPGELAYFAQVSAVAETLELAQPLALPRWSCTIVEPHVARVLDRYGIEVDELAHEHAVEMRLARASMPEPVRAKLDELRGALARSMADLAAASSAPGTPLVDPRVLEGARIAIVRRLDRLERRLVSAVARNSADTARDIATARGALYPRGRPQERALNFLPILARQGDRLVAAMVAEASRYAERLLAPAGPDGGVARTDLPDAARPARGDSGG